MFHVWLLTVFIFHFSLCGDSADDKDGRAADADSQHDNASTEPPPQDHHHHYQPSPPQHIVRLPRPAFSGPYVRPFFRPTRPRPQAPPITQPTPTTQPTRNSNFMPDPPISFSDPICARLFYQMVFNSCHQTSTATMLATRPKPKPAARPKPPPGPPPLNAIDATAIPPSQRRS